MPTNAVRKHSSRLTGEPSSAKATVAMTQPGKDASGKTHGLLSAPASTRAPNKSNAAGGCAEGTKEHPSMTSPSNTESKTEKQPSNSINSDNNHGGKGRRGRRNAKQNSGNEVSAAGLSTTVEPSTAKSEGSSATKTIPPVSQKKSQSRRKAEPKPSSCETLTSTDVPRAPPTDVKKEPVLTASLASSLPPKVSPQTAPIAHRNNTVRLASTRQKPRQECIDFILGRCQKGDECQRLHLPHDSSECRAYQFGICRLGLKCPRPHVPVKEECMDFSRGRCGLGKRCQRLHLPRPTVESVDNHADVSGHSSSSAESTPPATPRLHSRTIPAVSESSPTGSVPNSLKFDLDRSATLKHSTRILAPTDASGNEICLMYLEDKCKWGARCQRSHPPRWEWIKFLPRSEEVCQEYIEGRCFLGENCRRRHPPQPTPAEGKRSSSARLATTKETSTSVKTKNNGATVVQQVEIPAPTDRVSKPNAPVATASCTPTGQQSKGKGRMMENTPIKAVRSVPTEVFRTMKQDTAKSSEQADSTSLPSVQKDNPPNLDRSGMENDEIRVGGICWDFQHGRCRRAQCKYRHEQPGGVSQSGEEGTQRLISMLKWSVNELSKMLPSQTRNDLMQDGRAFPPTQRTVPDVPPGLSKIKENTPTRMTEGSSPDAPSTMSLRVQDSVTVTFGPGFAIQEVVTGFESRVLILKNIPSHVTSSMIKKTLDPFGDVVNIHLPENRPAEGGKTVKATFTNHRNAAAAASALDGCTLFKAHITAILASQQSTSLGKGTVRDGDVLLEFPAPHRDAYVGYSTLQGAEHATRTAYRAQMGDSILSASIYSGLPIVGRYNVKFRGLPPDTETVEMEAFGPNNAVMFTRPNYMSLDDALKELQARLEIYGELISVKVISPPFENQTVRAWAHFTTPTAADEACRDFNFRRPRYFGHGTVKVQHVMSITYQLPNRIFDVLSDTLRYLRSCVYTTAHRCDIIFQSRLRAQTGSVGVKLSAEALPTLTRLKSSFEGILRGEVVRFEGRAAWDSFFARSSGAEFIATLEASHPMVIIQIDLVKSCIRLFGSPHRTWRARTAIQEQMIKLRSRKVHSLPLDRNLLGIFMNSDLLKLQQELGTENVYIDSRTWSLKVRGNNDAVQVATLIIQRARRQCGRKHPGENSCPICLDKVSLPVTLDCGHTWCKNCLTSYLLAAIDTKSFPLNCLGSGARCSSQIPLKIAHRLLSSEDFQRVIHASFLAYIHSRPSEFHYCPTPDCQQVYRTAPPDTVLQCPSCLVRICGNCHIEHHEGKRCPDPEKEELRLFEEWSVGRDVKRCPGCKTFIEREAGCNHMTCTRCRTHICWVCLETFSESEACYDHMRKTHGGIGL